MATFTPTVSHSEYFASSGTDRLWSRVPYQRAELILVEGDIVRQLTVVDSDQLITAEANGTAFHYDHTYEVDDVVDTLLHGAGLDPFLVDEDYPAWL